MIKIRLDADFGSVPTYSEICTVSASSGFSSVVLLPTAWTISNMCTCINHEKRNRAQSSRLFHGVSSIHSHGAWTALVCYIPQLAHGGVVAPLSLVALALVPSFLVSQAYMLESHLILMSVRPPLSHNWNINKNMSCDCFLTSCFQDFRIIKDTRL